MAPAALARRGRSQGATSRACGRPPGGRGRRWAAAAWRLDAASIRGTPGWGKARGAAFGRCVPGFPLGQGLPYGIHAARPSAAACGVSVKPLTVVCSGGLRPSCPAAGKPEARAEGICVAPPETDPHSLGSRLGLHGIGHPPPPASAFSSGISLGLPGTGRGPPLALAFSSGMRHGHDVQRPPLQRWLSRAGGVWSAGLLRPSRPEFPGQTVGFARRSSRMHTGRARLRQVFAPRSGAPPCVASLSSP
jgi:hypothetical protein